MLMDGLRRRATVWFGTDRSTVPVENASDMTDWREHAFLRRKNTCMHNAHSV